MAMASGDLAVIGASNRDVQQQNSGRVNYRLAAGIFVGSGAALGIVVTRALPWAGAWP